MIRIVEVAPRDGLQNHPLTIPVEIKVAFIDALSKAGLSEIEAGAFVSPHWVPQLADTEDVFRRIRRVSGVTYSALVPNLQGLDRAFAARVDKIAVFTAASETFNRKNINSSIEESIRRFAPVVEGAKKEKLRVRGYVSTAFWCPYEGKVAPEKALEVCRRLVDLGVDEISVGDTIGKASPEEVRALLETLLPAIPANRLAMHFHDTYRHAVENVVASWKLGIEAFDASAGGIGGCPYAPGASGNVATEAVVAALREAGAEVLVDLKALDGAWRVIAPALTDDSLL
jgi:hydroxymethylglutaryl-CoA lyase